MSDSTLHHNVPQEDTIMVVLAGAVTLFLIAALMLGTWWMWGLTGLATVGFAWSLAHTTVWYQRHRGTIWLCAIGLALLALMLYVLSTGTTVSSHR